MLLRSVAINAGTATARVERVDGLGDHGGAFMEGKTGTGQGIMSPTLVLITRLKRRLAAAGELN
jgi:hypothetical protein